MIPMKDTIIIEKSTGFDDWGRPLDPEEITAKGRVDYRNEVVKDKHGNDVVSKAVILLKGMVVFTVEDTVKWVDAYGEHEEKPVSVAPIKDLSNKVIMTKVVI